MTLDEIVEQSLWQWRFFSGLFWVAAGVALLLASVGLYGVMAYSMARKRREIGVRMAIGAQRRDVLRTMLLQGAAVLVAGLLIGLFAAWGLGQAMGSFLYGIEGSDPIVFVLALVLLSSVAMVAILAPSLRASRIDPQEALRIH
jgi:ABC-type antimicrobial peptide transport system permease subunit